jgi:hypothetical protein
VSEPVHSVEIDRIRLRDLEMTPERAEHIRAKVEAELQRLLERERWSYGLAGGELSRLNAPKWHVDMSQSDSHLANGLARSIAQALRSTG